MGYPTWKYHAKEEAKIVDSDDALEAGWFDCPKKAKEAKAPPVGESLGIAKVAKPKTKKRGPKAKK
ncbi:hypothetical protein KAR91_09155 [Candidatus Pacearchaeota archaeon]|nr:hypothetical protein [Candidatus Pacearchaeota archaeon]